MELHFQNINQVLFNLKTDIVHLLIKQGEMGKKYHITYIY